MKKRPWMKFSLDDWEADPTLLLCTRAAGSFWLSMLRQMHRAEPYGLLLVNGRAPSTEEIAVMCGRQNETVNDVAAFLAELEVAGVFSRTQDGVIYSRRMVADYSEFLKAQEDGKRGGNPALVGERPAPSTQEAADRAKDKRDAAAERQRNSRAAKRAARAIHSAPATPESVTGHTQKATPRVTERVTGVTSKDETPAKSAPKACDASHSVTRDKRDMSHVSSVTGCDEKAKDANQIKPQAHVTGVKPEIEEEGEENLAAADATRASAARALIAQPADQAGAASDPEWLRKVRSTNCRAIYRACPSPWLDPNKGSKLPISEGVIDAFVDAGVPLHEVIIPTINRVLARRRSIVHGWSFFADAIREAHGDFVRANLPANLNTHTNGDDHERAHSRSGRAQDGGRKPNPSAVISGLRDQARAARSRTDSVPFRELSN